MKKYTYIIMLMLIVLLLSSCVYQDANTDITSAETTTEAITTADSIDEIPENALEVYSVYSSKNYLLPEEFDKNYYNKFIYVDSEYYGLYTYTSVVKSKLCITNIPFSTSNIIDRVFATGAIFQGTASHLDGSVVILDSLNGTTVERLVANERLASLIKKDNENVYIITGATSDSTVSDSAGYKIYHAYIDKDAKEWKWKTIEHLSECPMGAIRVGNTIYMTAEKSIFAYDILTENCTKITMPDYFEAIAKISIVALNDKLYIGSRAGIVEVDLETQKSLWYPIYFDEFLG